MPLFTRLLGQQTLPHAEIAPGPRLQNLRFLTLFFLAILPSIYVVFFIIFSIPYLFTLNMLSLPWNFLVNAAFYFSFGGVCWVSVYYWKRIEARRLAASSGEYRLLANAQPQPDADALHLPAAINTSRMLDYRLLIGLEVLLAVLLVPYISFILKPLLPTFWSLAVALSCYGLLLLLFFFMSRMRNPLEVTQEGIRTRTKNGTSLIFWHEMRLFACYPEPGPWKNSPALIFELSSTSHVIHWTWLRRPSPWRTFGGRFLPFGEQNAQLQAFCSLIVAQTGLPLYDLGKGQTLQAEHSGEAGVQHG